jgi:hypothetical protein
MVAPTDLGVRGMVDLGGPLDEAVEEAFVCCTA